MKRLRLHIMHSIWLATFFCLGGCVWANAIPEKIVHPAFPSHADSSRLIAMVLLNDSRANFMDDVAVTVVLPSGHEIPITTRGGFFSLQIEEIVAPTDSILLRIPAQVFTGVIATTAFAAFTQKISMQEVGNKEIYPPYVSTPNLNIVLDASDESRSFTRGKDLNPGPPFALPEVSKKAARRQERNERRMIRKNIPFETQ
jgi:hypothetical protein